MTIWFLLQDTYQENNSKISSGRHKRSFVGGLGLIFEVTLDSNEHKHTFD